jgi:hypothetical protein
MSTFKHLGENTPRTYTEDHYQQCVDFFKSPNIQKASVANYVIIGETSRAELLGKPCHFDISTAASVPKVVLVGTLTNINCIFDGNFRAQALPSSSRKAFARWLMNESHFSHLMVNKPEHRTVEWLLEEGGFIVSAELPQPILQMMMILSRTFSERQEEQFDKWVELVDKGLDPHIAYNITMCIANNNLLETQGVNSRTGHTTMYFLDTECMENFVKGELGIVFNQRSYRTSHSIYGCDKIFGLQNITTNFVRDLIESCEDFRDTLRIFRNKDTALEGYRPPNPFTQKSYTAPLKPTQVTYQELYEVVVPYIIEKGLFKP